MNPFKRRCPGLVPAMAQPSNTKVANHFADKACLRLFLGNVKHAALSMLVRAKIGSLLLAPSIEKGAKEALALIKDPIERKLYMSLLRKPVFDLSKVDALRHFLDVQDNKVLGVNFLLVKKSRLDLTMTKHFKHLGKYVDHWISTDLHPSIPVLPRAKYFGQLRSIILQKTNVAVNIAVRIPDELRLLTKLETFEVMGYPLVGQIPAWLGEWRNLRKFNVRNTAMRGVIPPSVGQCTKLETLNVSQTMISDQLPRELFACKELRALSFLTRRQDHRYTSLASFLTSFPKLDFLEMRLACALHQVDFSMLSDYVLNGYFEGSVASTETPVLPERNANGQLMALHITPNQVRISNAMSTMFLYSMIVQ